MEKRKWNYKKTLKTGKKYCFKCRNIMQVNLFYFSSRNKDGLKSECKNCSELYKIGKNYHKSLSARFRQYKNSAKTRRHEFNLSLTEFKKFWNKKCRYCEKFISGIGIDRVDNRLGYFLSNCVPCCKYCNRLKGYINFSHKKEIIKILKVINIIK